MNYIPFDAESKYLQTLLVQVIFVQAFLLSLKLIKGARSIRMGIPKAKSLTSSPPIICTQKNRKKLGDTLGLNFHFQDLFFLVA